MRRSQINHAIRTTETFIRDLGVHLPPFARYSAEDLTNNCAELLGVLHPKLGWDVTDFGHGDFERIGLTLITLRNGLRAGADAGPPPKPYAEKLLMVREGQRTPLHTHRRKIEDIIHRGGVGTLVIELRPGAPSTGPTDGPIDVWTDGIQRHLNAGERLELGAGESVTLRPGQYHAFWADGGAVLAGEVSSVNDDTSDNVFHAPGERFTSVEEDEPAYRLLVSDYDAVETEARSRGGHP